MSQPRSRLLILIGLLLLALLLSLSAGTVWLTPGAVLDHLIAHDRRTSKSGIADCREV